MAFYSGIFDSLGLREWCDADKQDGPLSMAQLIARRKAAEAGGDAQAAMDAVSGPAPATRSRAPATSPPAPSSCSST